MRRLRPATTRWRWFAWVRLHPDCDWESVEGSCFSTSESGARRKVEAELRRLGAWRVHPDSPALSPDR